MKRAVRNFTRKYQEIIIPFLLTAVAGAGIVFGVVPAVFKVTDLWGKVSLTRESVASLSKKKNFLESLDQAYLESQLKTVVSGIPQDKSLPSVLGVIDSLSNQTGVTLLSLNILGSSTLSTASGKTQTTEEKALGSSLLPFTITIAGPYSNIRAFISTSAKVRRLVRLSNFDISVMSSASATLRANLDAFYAPLPKLVPFVEQNLPNLTDDENATLAKLGAYPWLTRESLTLPPGTNSVGRSDPFSH